MVSEQLRSLIKNEQMSKSLVFEQIVYLLIFGQNQKTSDLLGLPMSEFPALARIQRYLPTVKCLIGFFNYIRLSSKLAILSYESQLSSLPKPTIKCADCVTCKIKTSSSLTRQNSPSIRLVMRPQPNQEIKMVSNGTFKINANLTMKSANPKH